MTFETVLTPELIEHYTSQGLWTDRVITDFLDEVAAEQPDKLAAIDSRGQVTYAELKRLSDRAALGLLELGVRPGDVVSFQLPNWIEFLIVHFAVTRIGAVNNPLIPIYRDREVGFMVGLARSKVIVIPQEFRGFGYPEMIERLRGNWPALQHVLVVDGPTTDTQTSWREFIDTPWEQRRDAAELAGLRPDPNDVTLLIFTSGTTGEPKGVMHTHNTLVAANAPLPARLGASRDSVIHMASTFAHLTGFLYGARLPTQVGGATAVYQDIWDPARFAELVEEHRITYTSAATPFLHDTLNAPNLAQRDLSSLRLFACMGAPIPRAMVREARVKLPSLTVLGGWGQSENGLVTLGIPGDPEEKIVERDGYPWPGMEIRVVDFDGSALPAGKEGRLQVRGPFLFVGYAERLEMTRASFQDDWFDTGDLAVIDEDRYLNITGRTKDVVIRGGENIPVAYVENVLYENPRLAGVAVVGVPDPRLQERAWAVVTLAPGVDGFTIEEMRDFLAEKGVAKQYWPEGLEVLTELPRTASGKIQKFQLRARLAGAE
ncbi:MAG: AMP-dependent synthetase and ligase [Blastococcus sp.]|nr:AMP-dependent synthetase and ligase [Blastococcus sp.]